MSTTIPNQVEELRQLFGQPLALKIGDRTIELVPFEFERLADVLEAVSPMLDDLVAGELDKLALLKKHQETVFGLVALLSKQPVESVRTLPAFVGLRLFTACIEVNADFFSQGLTEIQKLMRLVPAKSSLNGPVLKSAAQSASAPATDAADPSRSDTGSGSQNS